MTPAGAGADDGPREPERRAFLRLLRLGVEAKVRQAEARQSERTTSLGPDSSGAPDPETELETSAPAFPRDRSLRVPAWQALAWRDAFSTEPYFEASVAGRPLRIKQILQGEMNGLGTGLTVWPAACVLLKHLEHRAATGTGDKWLCESGAFVVELGSGTGAVGIAAAMLVPAPARVVLSDVDKLQFLMRENAAQALEGSTASGGGGGGGVTVDVEAYEWGSEPSARLLPPRRHGADNQQPEGPEELARVFPDLVLVSDCILPRLYPVEPLADALAMLSGAKTRVLVSYEHRYYAQFDPKARFWELMRARGFALRELGEREYHPHYRAGDIEIWEITRSAT